LFAARYLIFKKNPTGRSEGFTTEDPVRRSAVGYENAMPFAPCALRPIFHPIGVLYVPFAFFVVKISVMTEDLTTFRVSFLGGGL
jgi:hypothetical protein